MLLKKPIASLILVLAVLIFGGMALDRLSVELLPDIARPTLLIRTDYSGVPAKEVEFRVTEPLESVLSSVRGIKKIEALSRQGQSLLFLTFDWGMDMDMAFLNVREKLDQVRYYLPDDADRPQLVYSSASDEPIATLALTLNHTENSGFAGRLALKQWAEQVFVRRLEQEDGIAQAVLVGAVQPEVHVKFSPKETDRYGLAIAQIKTAVGNANIFSSTGELRDGWYRYVLKIESRITSMDDLRAVPLISLANGRVLTLDDVASVTMDEADPTSFAMLDGEEVVNVLVKKEYGANTVDVYKTLLKTLDQVRGQNPDIRIEVIREDASYIENSISNLLQTLLLGGFLAFLVLFLFLDDFRSPFTIGISIPVSIFLTFIVMYLFNIQLNIISLSGLTLGIGLLLDNAIVVLENINRYRKQGYGRFEAAKAGTKEIGLAITASTLTTISVFLPLIFLGGFEGAFFRDLAATLSFSLMASLLVALFILPVFVVYLSQKNTSGSAGLFKRMSARIDRIITLYEQSLFYLIKRPVIVVAVLLLLVGGSIFGFLEIPKSILPEAEPSEVSYQISMPGNTALRSTQKAAFEVTNILKKSVGMHHIMATGGYSDDTNLGSITKEGLNKFKVTVPVNGFKNADSVESVFKAIAKTYPAWAMQKISEDGLGGFEIGEGSPLQFSFVGTDRGLSRRVASSFAEFFEKSYPKVELSEKYPQKIKAYQIHFNDKALMAFDLTEAEIINYLTSLTQGVWLSDWNRQDEQIAIRLRGDSRITIDPKELTLSIKNKTIPLTQLAHINEVEESEELERSAQAPVLTYNTGLTFMDWWWHGSDIKQKAHDFMQRSGREVKIGGSALQIIGMLEQLGFLLLVSVLLIYLILAIQYENLFYPLLIILSIPFAWLGGILALMIAHISLNALSFMGLLILTGIAVNDAILKVDFMRRYLEETGNLDEAVRQAGINRFRPVVMTSITTILGLLPMLLPYGDGYPFRQSLAIALMGGMFSSTILTLYLIPMVFRVLHHNRIPEPKAKLP